ncbi:MAG: hypothetical protein R3315_07315 [Woeseiaceae bacterium]|nr:hypothetical protein [Woeseiaceae bacterium]
MKKALLALLVAAVAVPVLFDVSVDYRLTLPHSKERADPQQEALYAACVERRDREIHAEVFERIDNPDVQREILYRRMQEAKAACQEEHPARTITVDVPFEFNLIDLAWRY